MYYLRFANGDVEKIQDFLKDAPSRYGVCNFRGILSGSMYELALNNHISAVKFLMDEYNCSFPLIYSSGDEHFTMTIQLLNLYEFPEEKLTDFLGYVRDTLTERRLKEGIEIIKLLVKKGADSSYLANDPIPVLRKLHLLVNPRCVWMGRV